MSLSRSTEIAASPEVVWALVSDLPAMGRFSPENVGGSWKGGATGPAVGARFTGRNRAGVRRWSTQVRVSRCEPGRAFAFDVSSFGLAVSRWSYDLEPTETGCRVTETWEDRRGRLVTTGGRLLTGVADRESHTAQGMERTLAAVKAVAESG
ncbi:MAG: SRPBCC family protein [Mycobacteriales bacterium]|nr:SRPBCC family protein [Mycobacteriales bacterium]